MKFNTAHTYSKKDTPRRHEADFQIRQADLITILALGYIYVYTGMLNMWISIRGISYGTS
jgi:hypothetical protein